MLCNHVMNVKRTPAMERAAEFEELVARQYVGKRVEWDPGDDHGIRRGIVTGTGRYDEGASRIGALCLTVARDEGEREGTKFSFPFGNEDAWKVISHGYVDTTGLPPAPGVCPICSGSASAHLDGCPRKDVS
jgi:hypothetical protein